MRLLVGQIDKAHLVFGELLTSSPVVAVSTNYVENSVNSSIRTWIEREDAIRIIEHLKENFKI